MQNILSHMPYEISRDLKKIKDIGWKNLVLKTAWDYSRKLALLNKMVSKSKFKKKNLISLDHEIKQSLLKHYSK